jgi:hypothetical protein
VREPRVIDAVFTSSSYTEIKKVIQPAIICRSITWRTHTLLDHSLLNNRAHLDSILESPAIEAALAKVTEGGVVGYYS